MSMSCRNHYLEKICGDQDLAGRKEFLFLCRSCGERLEFKFPSDGVDKETMNNKNIEEQNKLINHLEKFKDGEIEMTRVMAYVAKNYTPKDKVQAEKEQYLEEFKKWVIKHCKKDDDDFSVWEVWRQDFDNFKNGRDSDFEQFKKENKDE